MNERFLKERCFQPDPQDHRRGKACTYWRNYKVIHIPLISGCTAGSSGPVAAPAPTAAAVHGGKKEGKNYCITLNM